MTDTETYDLELKLRWQSHYAAHTDVIVFPHISLNNLSLPPEFHVHPQTLNTGNPFHHHFAVNTLIKRCFAQSIELPLNSLQLPDQAGIQIKPSAGRYYPRRLLAGMFGINTSDMSPMRISRIDQANFTADLNHPLSDRALEVSIYLYPVTDKQFDTPRQTIKPMDHLLASGIGLQKTFNEPLGYLDDACFLRQDDQRDVIFYQTPRMVSHIDRSASDLLAHIYAEHVKENMRILDLMSSWQSHLPGNTQTMQVIGLGMNEQELAANRQLRDYVVQDLNENTHLPFEDGYFDSCICNLSFEYLTKPVAVLREIVRVTQPGGKLFISFSNRCFPSKAIAIWNEIHPFERMALILDLMRQAGGLSDLRTETFQGQLRANDDPYAKQLPTGDPVFIVSGTIDKTE